VKTKEAEVAEVQVIETLSTLPAKQLVKAVENGTGLSDTIKDMLFADNGLRMTLVADALIKKAEEGNLSAIGMLYDRLEGKVAQRLDIDATSTHTTHLVATSQVLLERLRAPAKVQQIEAEVKEIKE